jgi:hypothetical protein
MSHRHMTGRSGRRLALLQRSDQTRLIVAQLLTARMARAKFRRILVVINHQPPLGFVRHGLTRTCQRISSSIADLR